MSLTAFALTYRRITAVAAAIIGDEPVDGVWASDHFGVMADLRY